MKKSKYIVAPSDAATKLIETLLKGITRTPDVSAVRCVKISLSLRGGSCEVDGKRYALDVDGVRFAHNVLRHSVALPDKLTELDFELVAGKPLQLRTTQYAQFIEPDVDGGA